MKRLSSVTRRPWWSVDEAASYLAITTSDLRELGAAGVGPRYTEDFRGMRCYRPSDVRLWASTGLVRDSRGWNGEAL
ncbi:hypothetical protein C7C46_11405 [Streptomyces tateyamensis]|uniref:DNA-binding protein n=1 Tax=Streptomyces tateyamensis TaxID=565073 RepID=A0A2V4NNK4_9ACTN|nr:hypothetical protein C7C46_11405 [Streptomyces tateyamensis]